MKVYKYKYNPNKAGVFRISVVKNPAVGEGDLVLMAAADLESGDAPIVTYADMLVKNNDGKVLLLKRNSECEFEPNKWGFPGGKVMPGETTKDGAIRECFEECGIIINPESVTASGEVVNNDKTSSHYFTGTPTNELKLGDEHQDYAWVDENELDNYELILNNKDRFKKLISGDNIYMSAQEVKGIFYSPVMIPDFLIDRIDENGEPFKVSYDADTVEQLAINYFKQCGNRNTNLEHETENIDGVYPVESWIVQNSETDKSKAIGMPTQKVGTWIMGYKADNPEVLDKIKNNLLQGLSIEGQLDKEEDYDNPITKFNKQTMEKTLLEAFADLKTVIMSAISGKEEEKPVEEMAAEDMPPTEEPSPAEPTDAEKEIASLKAELEMKDKQIADLEAELAAYKNNATLMSSQVEELKKSFEDYKTVQMSSQKLSDIQAPAKVLTPIEAKHAKFLEDVQSKLK